MKKNRKMRLLSVLAICLVLPFALILSACGTANIQSVTAYMTKAINNYFTTYQDYENFGNITVTADTKTTSYANLGELEYKKTAEATTLTRGTFANHYDDSSVLTLAIKKSGEILTAKVVVKSTEKSTTYEVDAETQLLVKTTSTSVTTKSYTFAKVKVDAADDEAQYVVVYTSTTKEDANDAVTEKAYAVLEADAYETVINKLIVAVNESVAGISGYTEMVMVYFAGLDIDMSGDSLSATFGYTMPIADEGEYDVGEVSYEQTLKFDNNKPASMHMVESSKDIEGGYHFTANITYKYSAKVPVTGLLTGVDEGEVSLNMFNDFNLNF